MKITPAQYANALYESTKDKSQGEINSVARNFVGVLSKNNQLKFKNKIIEKFQETYNKENGIVEAIVTSRSALDDELHNILRNKVSNKYKAKEVVLIEKVDASIRGGVIVRVGDEVMDGSVRRKLRKLKKFLTK